jgi:hypothetical protein
MTTATPIPAEFEERLEVASTDLEKVAERARRNLAFRLRLWPEPRTTPEQLQAAIERGRAALRRRAELEERRSA